MLAVLAIIGWLVVLAIYLLGIVYFLSERIAATAAPAEPFWEWTWARTRDLLWWPALMVAGIKAKRSTVKRALGR